MVWYYWLYGYYWFILVLLFIGLVLNILLFIEYHYLVLVNIRWFNYLVCSELLVGSHILYIIWLVMNSELVSYPVDR